MRVKSNWQNLLEILAENARKYPDKVFIIYGRKKITFKQLDNLSSWLAGGFERAGISPGDKISLWLYNCPEFVIAYFAGLKAGACIVPINDMLKPQEVKHIIEDSRSKLLITSIDKVETALSFEAQVPSLEGVISFPDARTFYKVGSLYRIMKKKQPPSRIYSPGPEDTASIIYTSGTTGKPKGACLTHRNFISNVSDCVYAINSSRRETIICILPLFHSFAFTVCLLIPLYVAGKTVIMRSLSPFKRVLRTVFNNRVSVFVGVPSLFNILKQAKVPWFLRLPLVRKINPVRVCISGAAALPKETIYAFEKRTKIPLIEGYGLTEASPVVSLNPLRGRRKPGSVGLPLRSVQVKISPVQPKEGVGELLVKGPNVMKEYFNMPLETAETIKGGWLYTGDLASIDEDGYIYIVGRKKEMINVRGFNVYPREVEDVLYMHPDVKEVAVVGMPHPHKGEVPVAFIVLKQGRNVSTKDILSFLRNNLALYKVPFRIEFRNMLPKNATGKILKYVLAREVQK